MSCQSWPYRPDGRGCGLLPPPPMTKSWAFNQCLRRIYWQLVPREGVRGTAAVPLRQLDRGFYGIGCPHPGVECLVAQISKNILMQVIDLGWKQFAITWSHKGAKRSVDELATHLKMIIREEKRLTPPKDPALEMPKRPELPILGTASQQLIESNATATIDEDEFRKQAEELRRQREVRGEGSIFSIMQPLDCPELDELINKRIDVLYSFQLDSGEKALRWCQGK